MFWHRAPAAAGEAGFANPLVRQRADPRATRDGWYYFSRSLTNNVWEFVCSG
jgi:GH43 family beta-xylosidase